MQGSKREVSEERTFLDHPAIEQGLQEAKEGGFGIWNFPRQLLETGAGQALEEVEQMQTSGEGWSGGVGWRYLDEISFSQVMPWGQVRGCWRCERFTNRLLVDKFKLDSTRVGWRAA